jgi:hypothetical protein
LRIRNEEARNEKLRIRKPQSVKRFMKSIWKSHEVARGKGPLS